MQYSDLTGIIAPEAGWTPPIRYLLRRARILHLLRVLPKGRLLEVGCGAGALLCDVTRMGLPAQGLETSAAAISMGHSLAKLASSPHNIAAQPSFDWLGRFDTLCAFDVLEHIEDDGDALDAWMQWLAPAGKLILSVPAHRARWGEGDVWAGHWRRYDRQDLLDLMAAHDLEVQHIECYGFPLANATEWLGNRIYRRMIDQRGQHSKAQATAASGIDRRSYSRIGRLVGSFPGRACMRAAMAVQHLTRNTDLGSGYLLVASRR